MWFRIVICENVRMFPTKRRWSVRAGSMRVHMLCWDANAGSAQLGALQF